MNTNRPNRASTNVRAIIANMGRSIDEARDRRLRPVTSSQPVLAPEPELRIGDAAPAQPQMAVRPAQSEAPPPLRSATEMFDSSGNRLKARPKRAS